MEGTWAMETIMHTFKGAVHYSLGENTHSYPDKGSWGSWGRATITI